MDKAQASADSDSMSVCDTRRMKMTALKTIHAGLLKQLKRCKSANQECLLEKKLGKMDHKMLLEADKFDKVATTGSLSITSNPFASIGGKSSSPIPIETSVSSTLDNDDDDKIPTWTSN
ncbi:unnamed protein product [Cylindrotheca closterium]|uniref:Uncharacterized protein n=1 Tax=Cylindrotheca closterium TaxID=2856 RepID=A0AAD2FVG3_9STRA|nr:unnamed protein product [Cylindrotheca closterium]